jgi:hypothetical protein
MASFTMDIKGLKKLQFKYAQIADEFKNYAIIELDAAVKKMESEAEKKSSKQGLQILNPNSKYKRTGKLSRSVFSKPYKAGYAVIGMGQGINYAPYVEFGTGSGYGYPYTATKQFLVQAKDIARTFKGSNQKSNNMKARSFFFSTINKNMNALYRKLNSYKPKG